MEVLSQVQKVQALVVEHAFTIGIGLLVATVIAGIAWYWLSRGPAKSDVLENHARVNMATTAPMSGSLMTGIPPSAQGAEPPGMRPTQEDLEQQNNMLAQIAAHNAAKANGQE